MSFLVDPSDVIDFNRSDSELELFYLFCSVVAGKTAKTQARLLEKFLLSIGESTPFACIAAAQNDGTLLARLIDSRLGQYNRLYKQFVGGLALNLRTCTVEELEAVHGCGPKTARMFIMMTRADQRVAALDTHVLKYLASRGLQVPKATPSSGPTYRKLESAFLGFADESGMPPADFDLQIWRSYARP